MVASLQNQLVMAMQPLDKGYLDRGVKERPSLCVLRESMMPAALVELGFIDSADVWLLKEHQVLVSLHGEVLRIAKLENAGKEVALVTTISFGRPIKVLGDEHSVNIEQSSQVNALKMNACMGELVVVHNHPTTRNFSFSDIGVFVIDEDQPLLRNPKINGLPDNGNNARQAADQSKWSAACFCVPRPAAFLLWWTTSLRYVVHVALDTIC